MPSKNTKLDVLSAAPYSNISEKRNLEETAHS